MSTSCAAYSRGGAGSSRPSRASACLTASSYIGLGGIKERGPQMRPSFCNGGCDCYFAQTAYAVTFELDGPFTCHFLFSSGLDSSRVAPEPPPPSTTSPSPHSAVASLVVPPAVTTLMALVLIVPWGPVEPCSPVGPWPPVLPCWPFSPVGP